MHKGKNRPVFQIGNWVQIIPNQNNILLDCFKNSEGIITEVGKFNQVIPGYYEYKVFFPNCLNISPRTKDRYEFFFHDELILIKNPSFN